MRLRLGGVLVSVSASLLLACSGTSEPTIPSGTWVGTSPYFREIRIRFSTEPTHGTTFDYYGEWTAVRANCTHACADTGAIIGASYNRLFLQYDLAAVGSGNGVGLGWTYSGRLPTTPWHDSTLVGPLVINEEGVERPEEQLVIVKHP